MNLLAIETSGLIGSVALCRDDAVIFERSFQKGLIHGRELMPAIKAGFDQVGWKPADMDLIALSIGPGSFTGLRVGVACAKTLAFALKKDVVAVPTLDVLAENAPADAPAVCPILDARREYVYAAIYERAEVRDQKSEVRGQESTIQNPKSKIQNPRRRATALLCVPPAQLAALLPPRCLVFGDGATRYRDILAAREAVFGPEELSVAKARVVARLGLDLYRQGQKVANPHALTPLYLRRSEAEEKWAEKQALSSSHS
ncbi:MAG: tRNA (adenosine(37)-N6)-threonylcarbamoyltransferase complex dimerization subunit type 1 TsaB [Planctomycetes bacterium]|nr:tRNA (adenosine(37)-N6)-threonylcarbamoyltransferase complex dimerization subunit type 1 TsaB [Planctomycetota bacterium]